MENYYDKDFINEMIAISMLQKLIRTKHFGSEGIITILGKHEGKKLSRELLECHSSIKCEITDKDMLLERIDWALENEDRDLFMNLTNELKEIETIK